MGFGGGEGLVLRTLRILTVLALAAAGCGPALAAGPYGSIHVGSWTGGAYTNDNTGAFSFCGAETRYANGMFLAIGQQASGDWLLSIGLQSWQFEPNTMVPMELTFDGQAQFHLFGKPNTANTLYATLPSAAAVDQLRKSRGVAVVVMGQVFQLLLNSTGQLMPVIANCVVKTKAAGVSAAGDFSIAPPKPAAPPQASTNAAAPASVSGPYGSIRVEGWVGGAYTDTASGAFSYCAVTAQYPGGAGLSVGLQVNGTWWLGVNMPSGKFERNTGAPVDLTFDGQAQFHAFGMANSPTNLYVALPTAAIQPLGKSRTVVISAPGQAVQANVPLIGQVLPIISNCVTRTKVSGVSAAGDFALTTAQQGATPSAQGSETASAAPEGTQSKSKILVDVNGTGFVINTNGYILTNNHVIADCVGDIHGNLTAENPMKLRVVSADETNDLALLQGPTKFPEAARLRGTAVHSGDSVVAIGYPFHDFLTSDFTVTTGVVSSLSGLLNNTRQLQISAPVQPGNSGGPLFDMSGNVIGVVAEKLDSLLVAKATGDIPQNVNFAIKTGPVRDFLDNSGVTYQIADAGAELKVPQIAANARAFTMLITCSAKVEEKK